MSIIPYYYIKMFKNVKFYQIEKNLKLHTVHSLLSGTNGRTEVPNNQKVG